MPKVFQLLFCLLFFGLSIQAQDAYAPKGQFLKDSTKVGELIPYTLSMTYPSSWQVVFPDSLYDFSPFEYENRIYFPTQSNDSLSTDSAVYYLSTFELDEVQTLRMAVRIKRGSLDFEELVTKEAEIALIPLVIQMPDSLNFIQNTTFGSVQTRVNYPYLLFALVAMLVVVGVLYSIYGDRVRRWWIIRQLEKSHRLFLADFDKGMDQLMQLKAAEPAERQLAFWKRYMESILQWPVAKWTTKEIIRQFPDWQLEHEMKTIDRSIYAMEWSEEVLTAFAGLRKQAELSFERVIMEIKEAKDGK